MSTLAGHPLVSCALVIPRVGAWVADVVVDVDQALTGVVDLTLEGRTWRGTARGGVELGRWHGRITGAAGLASVLGPAPFADTTLATVLGETVRDVGEAIAATSGELTAAVARWARIAGPALNTVADVARAAGYAWRVLDAGTIWLGVETWEALALGTDLDVTGVDHRAGRRELAGAAALAIDPGRVVTIDGVAVRVGGLEHRLDGSTLRTLVFEEREADPPNRLLAAFEGTVRRTMRHTDFHTLYPCAVIAQRSDGTLDLQPDSASIAAPRGVPYRTLAGVTVKVPAGTRVHLGFEGGDPARPVAMLWERGAVTSLAVAAGTHEAARKGHAVRVTIPVGTVLVSSPGGPVPNAAPIPLDGTITEGTDVLLLP